ncbi:MAG: hypothetical protein ISS26_04775 [Candidatus Omnitrophica bacterium]|nr:hypothetical protein [Candidatus Omnitrophota bacterium]
MIVSRKQSPHLFILPVLIILAGCGYTAGSLLPPDIKTIYVDNFNNSIEIDQEVTDEARYTLYRPGLENDVTNIVVDRFIFDGNLKVANKDNADLILSGELIEYRQEALRYDSDDNVEEYRVKVVVNVQVKDVAKDKLMWEEAGFTGESTYMTVGRFVVSEDTARENALEDLARRIVERTIEGW